MSAFEAFATGFLTETARNINVRKDQADDYFQQQMERARTRGADALATRKNNLNNLTNVANTLRTQANMPEDVLRVVINQGPETLQQVQEIYNTAASKGQALTEDFWRNVVDFSTTVKPEDQSLNDFLSETVGLFGNNLEATSGEGGDPFSAFMASGLGLNAMDKARERLDQEEMFGGYTAGDLLAMESRPEFSNPLGTTDATIDLTAASNQLDSLDPLSVTEVQGVNKYFADTLMDIKSTESAKPDGTGIDWSTPEGEATIRRMAAERVLEEMGESALGSPLIFGLLNDQTITETELPPEVTTEVDPLTATGKPPIEDTVATEPMQYKPGDVVQGDNNEVYTVVRTDEQGQLVLMDKDGNEVVATDKEEAPQTGSAPTEELTEGELVDPTLATMSPDDVPPDVYTMDGVPAFFEGYVHKENASYVKYIDADGKAYLILLKE